MNSVEVKVCELFKNKFGEKEAGLVKEYVDFKTEAKFLEKRDILATKQDIAELKLASQQDIAGVRKEITEVKADIIKWMFLFWTGTVITILGGLFAFLKLFLDK